MKKKKRYKSKGREYRIDEQVNAVCPCGAQVSIGYDEEGKGVVLHALPMCRDYGEKAPMEYVTWLRRKTVGYFPGEDS